eukprot:363950-Chlamydomonas_euryale.AAC.3
MKWRSGRPVVGGRIAYDRAVTNGPRRRPGSRVCCDTSSSRKARQNIRGFFTIHREGDPETVAAAPARRGHGRPPRAPAPAQPVVPE